MNSLSEETQDLLKTILITIAGLIVWLFGLLLLYLFLRLVGLPAQYLNMVEAFSGAVTAAALLGGGYLAYRELNEQAALRHLEITDRLFEELNSKESISARRWVFQNLPDDPAPEKDFSSLSEEDKGYIKTVLNSLDRVAFLAQGNWIPDEVIMPWMNPMIVKAWAKLGPYVAYERRRRKEPDYYQQAQELAEGCVAWRKENLPEAKITWVEDAL